jgi:hypothetical protein
VQNLQRCEQKNSDKPIQQLTILLSTIEIENCITGRPCKGLLVFLEMLAPGLLIYWFGGEIQRLK